jgi:nitric oxide reductase NorQ protein
MGKTTNQKTSEQASFAWLPWSEALEDLEGHVRNQRTVIMVGPRGCGKTTMAVEAANRLGRPYDVFNFGGVQDSEAFLHGKLVLKDGQTLWVTSDFVDAIRTPNTIVIGDEVNRCSKTIHNALLSVFDHQGVMRIDMADGSERKVHVAPGVTFIGIGNVGSVYVGTMPIDPAFSDRFFCMRISYPENEVELLGKLGVSVATSKKLVRLAKHLRAQHEGGAIPVGLSTRRLLGIGELMLDGYGLEKAIAANVHVYTPEELAAVMTVAKAVL